MKTCIYCLFAVAALCVIVSMIKTKRFTLALLTAVLQGVVALFAADYIGGFFGVNMPVNPQTLAVSAVGGIPGVIFLLVSEIFFV